MLHDPTNPKKEVKKERKCKLQFHNNVQTYKLYRGARGRGYPLERQLLLPEFKPCTNVARFTLK